MIYGRSLHSFSRDYSSQRGLSHLSNMGFCSSSASSMNWPPLASPHGPTDGSMMAKGWAAKATISISGLTYCFFLFRLVSRQPLLHAIERLAGGESRGGGHFVECGHGVLLVVLLGVGESQAVHVVEETAQPVLEHPRHVGAAVAASVHHVLHGKMGVKIEFFFINGVANALRNVVNGVLGRGVALFLLFWLEAFALFFPHPVGMQFEDEHGDVAGDEHQAGHGQQPGIAGEDGWPEQRCMDDGHGDDFPGIVYGEVVHVGVGFVVHQLAPLQDGEDGAYAEECGDGTQGDTRQRDVVQGAIKPVEPRHSGIEKQHSDEEGYRDEQDECRPSPPIPLHHGAKVFVEQHAAVVGNEDEEIGVHQHPGIGVGGVQDGRHQQQRESIDGGGQRSAGIAVSGGLVVRAAHVEPAHHGKGEARQHVAKHGHTKEMFSSSDHIESNCFC